MVDDIQAEVEALQEKAVDDAQELIVEVQDEVFDEEAEEIVKPQKQTKTQDEIYHKMRLKAEADVRSAERQKMARDMGYASYEEMIDRQNQARQAEIEKKWEEEAEEMGESVVSYKKIKRLEQKIEFLEKDKEAEKARKAEEEKIAQEEKRIDQDLADFKAQNPDVNINDYLDSEHFQAYAEDFLEAKVPIGKIIKGYKTLMSGQEVIRKVKSRDERSVSSSYGGVGVSLTTDEAASLAEWNRANPTMKMTAKEYLTRKGD